MIKESDLPFEINDEQIRELIRLANFHENDVFYDLGSAKGRVIIILAKETHVKKAIGIEYERELHDKARESAYSELTKDQLKRTDFWLGDLDFADDKGDGYFYNLNDATVVYYGLDEDDGTIDHFKKLFGRKRHVKIITKNLPLVGYKSVANRSNPTCWFFLMNYPLTRIRSLRKWARTVKPKATIKEVYEYYVNQIQKQYPDDGKYARGNLLTLKKLVNERFG